MVKKQYNGNGKKSSLEVIVFIISLALVLSVATFLIILSFNTKRVPPDLKIQYSLDPSPNNENLYKVVLTNEGGETAENVKIEMELFKAGQFTEKSELEIQFAPKKSIREGWINFSGKPSPTDSVTVRILSYKKS